MDKEDVIGRIIHYITLLIPSLVILLSVGKMLHDPYSVIWIGGRGIIHVISALSLSTSFLFIYYRLSYLYPLVRMIITGCFTVFSIHLYDFFWSLTKYLQLGYDFRLVPLLAVLITVVLLERFDNKHGIFHFTERGKVTATIHVFILFTAFTIMAVNGFYEAMELSDSGMGPDPNAGCLEWAIGKIIVFWILTPFIQKRPYKAPLRLDPRVLIW